MTKRISQIVRMLGAIGLFGLALRCGSIPDTSKQLPEGYSNGFDSGSSGTGGTSSTGGSVGTTGGRSGNGGIGAGGIGAGGTGAGGIGAGGIGAGGIGAGGIGTGGSGGATGGLKCGNTTCREAHACCVAGASSSPCGFDVGALGVGLTGCAPIDQPGPLDSSCPDQTIGGKVLSGCCTPTGACGAIADASPIGPNLGCIDPKTVGLPSTGSCTSSCAGQGGTCTQNSDCCDVPTGPSCVTFAGSTGATCTAYCKQDADCSTGCCIILTNGRGACANDPTLCPAGCRSADDTCSSDGDCCAPNVCVTEYTQGPRLCRPSCVSNTDCAAGTFCVTDNATGKRGCAKKDAGLCTDTCQFSKNGSCEDGGKGSSSGICALGSDCTDCGPRIGGAQLCSDDCQFSKDGVCDDGGTHSTSEACTWGTDCTDCGPRSSICTDDCVLANSGTCDYDGACAPGTDCTDCGPFYGGRGENVCDGSKGTFCTERAGVSSTTFIKDSLCECSDCPWDAADCNNTSNLCDGVSISYCCDPSQPCPGYGSDGVACDCGGWCSWEVPDCGGYLTTPGP